jgi:hypothetical protein
MTKTAKFLASVAVVVVAMLAAAPSAQATSITFNLDQDHCGGSGCAPAGTIFGTVNLNDFGGTSVTVTVHLNSPFLYAKTGAADDQAFKFNAVGVVAGDITIAAHTPALAVTTGALNGDGTGNFGFGIACPSCGGGLSSGFSADIVFTVANATIADLTAPNDLGNIFVVDLGTSAGGTGPVAAIGPGTTVPEPLTLTLLGFGMLGLGAGMRRRMVK